MKKLYASIAAATVAVATAFAVEPADGIRLEYIESNGTQKHHIDLGLVGKAGYEFEVDMMFVSLPGDGIFMGARKAGNTNSRCYPFCYASQNGYYYGYTSYYYVSPKVTFSANTRYTLNTKLFAGEQTVSIDGVVKQTGTIADNLDTGRNLFLFAGNVAGSAANWVTARCYELKIWSYIEAGHEGERILVRDYVPYRGPSGNGLYDTVNGQWYYASSSNKDLGGVVMREPEEPDYYVEYLESTGTQFIDTEIEAGNGYRSLCDFEFTEIPGDGSILGSKKGGSTRSYLCYYYNGTFQWANGTLQALNPTYPAAVGTRYQVQMDMFRDSRILYINGEAKAPTGSGTENLRRDGQTYYLFALNQWPDHTCHVKIKCYGVQIWRSDTGMAGGTMTLIRDFHPCVAKDGKAGMYDTVTGFIFRNTSPTGDDFTVGPAIETDAAGVVVQSLGYAGGTVTPTAGTYTDLETGSSTDYSAEAYTFSGHIAYRCNGYTTATSSDGVNWSAESALVPSRSVSHTFDGTWWRLSWDWSLAGYKVSVAPPEQATVSYASDDDFVGDHYYSPSSKVTLTASETDGVGGTFFCWKSTDGDAALQFTRSIEVTPVNKVIDYIPYYRHDWTLVSEANDVKTVTDGIWTLTIKDRAVLTMATDLGGSLNLNGLDAILGGPVTAFADDNTPNHKGPATLTEVIAPDVVEIGNRVFQHCAQMTNAVFSANLRRVGIAGLCACGSLKTITPSLSQILSQIDIDVSESYAFEGLASITEDIVIVRDAPFTFPLKYMANSGYKTVDMRGCKGLVAFDREADNSSDGFLKGCKSLTTVWFPAKLANIPRGIFYGCTALTDIHFGGKLPASADIGYFYGYQHYKLKMYVPLSLNPNIVDDLNLRAVTDEDRARPTFPTDEEDKVFGVFCKETEGWGALDSSTDKTVREIWMIDCRPQYPLGTVLFIK